MVYTVRVSLIILVGFLYLLPSLSQSVIIKGKVYDATDQTPLSGVHVIYGEGQGTISSLNGNFTFNVSPGAVSVNFQYLGYKRYECKLDLKESDTLNLKIGLEPAFNVIDEIVVSPSRSEQKISELNVSTLLIKPARLTENHILKPEEIINQTQGIEVMDGQASIRGGSGYAYGVGSRVLVLADGYPTLAADAGNVKWAFLPLDNLSQIEVIKGASSVLYGSSALNGIINFRTREATATPSTRFSLTSGIYNNPANKEWIWWNTPRVFSNASFSYSQRIQNTGIGVGARFFYDNGYRRLNDETLGTVNLKIKKYSAKVKGLSYGLQFNSGYQNRIDFLLWENADSGALRQNEATATRLKATMLTIDPYISFDKGGQFKHDLRLRYQTTLNRLPENSNNNSDAHSLFSEYQLSYGVLQNLSLIGGIAGTFSQIISPFHGDHTALNLAGFTQLDYRPWSRLKLQAGFRAEKNRLDETQDKTIPIFRAGLNYQVARFTFLRGSFGQGYRYPSIAEKFAATTIGSIRIFPNPGIQPELGWGTELGVKQGISAMQIIGQVDFSLFYTCNTDLIEYIFAIYPDPETHEGAYGFRASNTEHSRIYGYEIETFLRRDFEFGSFSLRAGYTYMYPVEYDINTFKNTGEFLKYRRSHALNLISNTTYRKFDLGLNIFYRSKILAIDDVFTDELTGEELLPGFNDYWTLDNKGYFLFDGFLTYNLSEKYALSFGVKNITNTEYLGRPGDIRPPRSYSLQFRGSF